MSGKLIEAKKLVHDLVASQKSADGRLNQMEKKVEDLKKANKALNEHITSQTPTVKPIGDDTILSRYRNQDGSLCLNNKTFKKQIEGRGSLTFEQEGLLDATVPANDWHEELLRQTRDRTIARLVMKDPHTPKADARLYNHMMKAPKSILPAVEKAFNDVAGTGAEFIPDEFSTSLHEPWEVFGSIRSLLQTQEVDRNTILLPRLDRGTRPFIKGQITSNDPALYQATNLVTAQKSISIAGLATRLILDDSAAEDSAFAIVPLVRSTLAFDIEAAWEDCSINGDTTGAQDDLANWNLRNLWGTTPALGTSSDHRRLFNGWRKLAFDKASGVTMAGGGTAMDFDDIISALGQMSTYGVSDNVLIVSPEVMVGSLMKMSETKTLDVFGANAVILKGQIASVMGMPIIMSEYMPNDLNAVGVFDNVTKTQSGCLVVSMGSYWEYLRRGITVETDKDITSGAINVVATLRSVMGSPDADAKKNVCFIDNITY